MKKHLSVILSVILLLCAAYSAQAGFRVKKHTAAAAPATTLNTDAEQAHTRPATRKEQRRQALDLARKYLTQEGERNGRPRHRDDSGWEGIVALCCGIGGLLTGWLAIPAIIFGAIGMGKRKNRGLAIAGFTMGVVVVLIAILFIILAVSIFNGGIF